MSEPSLADVVHEAVEKAKADDGQIDPAAVNGVTDILSRYGADRAAVQRDLARKLEERDPLMQQHGLVWEIDAVVGCRCGFKSDLDQSGGWGDDVVDHLLKVGRQAGREG